MRVVVALWLLFGAACSSTPQAPRPDWAEVVRREADPRIVTNASIRKRIADSGHAWLVRDKKSGIELVLIPAGSYLRGAVPGDPDAKKYEKPPHHIAISRPFYLGRTEVTNGQYRRYRTNHDSKSFGDISLNQDEQPAVYVSWVDARGFCEAFEFRLPTEAEWEYALRAHTRTLYPWGDNIRGGQGHGNLCDNGAVVRMGWAGPGFPWVDGFSATAPVGRFLPNGFGVQDLVGNAWEWCADWFSTNEYENCANGVTDPSGPTMGRTRVRRGSCYSFLPRYARCSCRDHRSPTFRRPDTGFRVVRDP
jgi:formylglycine-generating enzyme required for sulfatase activity